MTLDIIEVQEGIWIREEWIRNAGLGKQLQVVVQPGEIRITSVTVGEETIGSATGWEAFRSLGEDAQPGKLLDASVNHDRYLYGKD